jgi:hypothetical protein
MVVMSIIPVFRSLKQKNYKLEASMGYIVNLIPDWARLQDHLKKQNKTKI